MIEVSHLLKHVIEPACALIGMQSQAAHELLLGTALQESGGGYLLWQQGGGPAVGIFQMDTDIYRDHWYSFILHRHALQNLLWGRFNGQPPADRMVTDLLLAAVMCRIHYFRVAEPLPEAGNIQEMAGYWKKHYNMAPNTGTTAGFVRNWHTATHWLKAEDNENS